MRFASSFQAMKRHFSALLTILSVATCLCFFLVSGPFFQSVIGAALWGNGESIYDAIHGGNSVKFLSFDQWILESFSLGFVLIAVATAALMTFASSARSAISLGSLALGIGLSALDWAYGGDVSWAIESIGYNLAGGLILAVTVYVISAHAPFVSKLIGISPRTTRAPHLTWPPLAGFLSGCVLYAIFRILLNPIDAQVELKMAPPYNGWYSGLDAESPGACLDAPQGTEQVCSDVLKKNKEALEESEEKKNFSFLSSIQGEQTKEIEWLGQADPLLVSWNRRSEEGSHLSISAAQGCVDSEALYHSKRLNILGRSDQSLILNAGRGLFEVRTLGERKPALVTVDDDVIGQFQVSKIKDSENLKLSRFLSSADIDFGFNSPRNDLEISIFAIRGISGDKDEGKIRISATADGKEYSTSFSLQTFIRAESRFTCTGYFSEDDSGNLVAEAPHLSLVIERSGPEEIRIDRLESHDSLLVSNANGWITADDIEPEDLARYVTPGDLSFFAVNGQGKRVRVAGRMIPVDETAQIAVYGDLKGSAEDAVLDISGLARAIFVDGRRMNLTRWESLDSSYQYAALIGLPALAIFLCKIALTTLQRNTALHRAILGLR